MPIKNIAQDRHIDTPLLNELGDTNEVFWSTNPQRNRDEVLWTQDACFHSSLDHTKLDFDLLRLEKRLRIERVGKNRTGQPPIIIPSLRCSS